MSTKTSRRRRFWMQTGKELISRINFIFTRKGLTRTAIRITGGAAYMDQSDAERMHVVSQSLAGFSGLGLFGGTQVRLKADPSVITPTICDIFPNLEGDLLRLGLIPKVKDLELDEEGRLVVWDEPNSLHYAVAHPKADELLCIQPSGDRFFTWEDEWRECVRILDELQQCGWKALLLVYNGGKETEKELLHWAKLSMMPEYEGMWNVLVIEGSGRTADKYAADMEFRRNFPSVRFVECNTPAIRQALVEANLLERLP